MKIPFLVLSAAVGYGGWQLRQKAATDEKASAPTPAVPQKESLEKALNWIKGLVATPVVGDTYEGTVKSIKESILQRSRNS